MDVLHVRLGVALRAERLGAEGAREHFVSGNFQTKRINSSGNIGRFGFFFTFPISKKLQLSAFKLQNYPLRKVLLTEG